MSKHKIRIIFIIRKSRESKPSIFLCFRLFATSYLKTASSIWWYFQSVQLAMNYKVDYGLNKSESKIKTRTLRFLTIVMISSTLVSLWRFQYFPRPLYHPVEQLWWSFHCENIKSLSIFRKMFHHRYLLKF